MKHYLYKTTNTLNGRYYVGRHSTEAREKVAASKRGRTRVYREDGTFFMAKVK